MLTQAEIDGFVADGFVRIERAFSHEICEAALEMLWRDIGADRHDPKTWTKPVVRLGGYGDPPFVAAANTPVLHAAYDQLIGRGKWVAPRWLGTFPIRFPGRKRVGDDGWHIDVAFPDPEKAETDPPNYLTWRANIRCQDRVLLMLFLFSDVGPDDAPTRIRLGSHRIVAEMMARAGERGLNSGLDGRVWRTRRCPTALATGPAGTVYLCHPFLVHAAQKHRGNVPRIMAQPPLQPVAPFDLEARPDVVPPVEIASREAWAKRPS